MICHGLTRCVCLRLVPRDIFFLSNQNMFHLETLQECWRRWKESTLFLLDFYMEIHGQRSEVINFDLRKKHFIRKYVFFRGYYSNPYVIKNRMPPNAYFK